jgi:hypothetical protein
VKEPKRKMPKMVRRFMGSRCRQCARFLTADPKDPEVLPTTRANSESEDQLAIALPRSPGGGSGISRSTFLGEVVAFVEVAAADTRMNSRRRWIFLRTIFCDAATAKLFWKFAKRSGSRKGKDGSGSAQVATPPPRCHNSPSHRRLGPQRTSRDA